MSKILNLVPIIAFINFRGNYKSNRNILKEKYTENEKTKKKNTLILMPFLNSIKVHQNEYT